MPVNDFEGETFVAFLDISGFKEMMKDKSSAMTVLGMLYQTGFEVLMNHSDVNGFFISDSGLLFARDLNSTLEGRLISLLKVIEEINRALLKNDIMLTTSVSYGYFNYCGRIEFSGIEKNPIYGNGYVSAFLDVEIGKPKIEPGQCRIVLTPELRNIIERANQFLWNRLIIKGKHCYFYWMVNEAVEIPDFIERYENSYKLKYSGMLMALQMR